MTARRGAGNLDEQRKRHLCQGGACTWFRPAPAGPVTVARFGRIKGRYVIHLARGMAVDEPHDRSDMGGIGGVWPWAYISLAAPGGICAEHARASLLRGAGGLRSPEFEYKQFRQ